MSILIGTIIGVHLGPALYDLEHALFDDEVKSYWSDKYQQTKSYVDTSSKQLTSTLEDGTRVIDVKVQKTMKTLATLDIETFELYVKDVNNNVKGYAVSVANSSVKFIESYDRVSVEKEILDTNTIITDAIEEIKERQQVSNAIIEQYKGIDTSVVVEDLKRDISKIEPVLTKAIKFRTDALHRLEVIEKIERFNTSCALTSDVVVVVAAGSLSGVGLVALTTSTIAVQGYDVYLHPEIYTKAYSRIQNNVLSSDWFEQLR